MAAPGGAVDGRQLLTYAAAVRYLLSLPPDAREKAYVAMRSSATKGAETGVTRTFYKV